MIRQVGEGLGQIKADAEAAIAPLLSGILRDTQTLFRQEVALAKSEVKEELVTAREAAMGFGLSAGAAGLAILMLSFGLVHLVAWAASIPLGAAFGIVGLGFGAIAAVSFMTARKALDETDLVPHQTIQTMKENVQWIAGT